jgi:uncharacterized membrane protein YkvA (DUF1232 family)
LGSRHEAADARRWFAARHPRTPWFPRLLALAVAAYALSPIDLIPDFIPVRGYEGDVILVPLGSWLVLRAPAISAIALALLAVWARRAFRH